ncbi:hypothetical protein VTG60DRAFT_1670 [Thermothelomyces hinnuleus]
MRWPTNPIAVGLSLTTARCLLPKSKRCPSPTDISEVRRSSLVTPSTGLGISNTKIRPSLSPGGCFVSVAVRCIALNY